MKRLLFAMLALPWMGALSVSADEPASPVMSLLTIEPRGYGYFVGDTFQREIDVTVREPYRLDAASRPSAGRLNYWLDLRGVEVTETERSDSRRYRITLDYQTFYVPLSPTKLAIPGMTLRFASDGQAASVDVPPLSLVMSPLREIQPEKPQDGPAGYLQPDRIPVRVSTMGSRIGFSAATLSALFALTLLAYDRAWWPFRARKHRPFTRALKVLRKKLPREDDPQAYRAGLLELHRAFDQTAGHRLLADDLPEFLRGHGAFQRYEKEIARFFAASRRVFFAGDLRGAARAMPVEAVVALGTRLSEAERKAA